MPVNLVTYNLLKIRTTFLVLLGLLLLALSSIGTGVWFAAPYVSAYVAHEKSELVYTVLYKLPDGSTEASSTPQGNAQSVPVLLYHGEGSASNLPEATFVDQMRALKEAGWQTVTMEQFDEWEKGEIQLPAKSFLLTFDDGRKDTYYEADPVLQDLGFNAVMFVITGFSLPSNGAKSDYYLNETELQEMVQSGRWELESHGDLDHAIYAVQSTTDLSQAASTTQGHFLSNKFWEPGTDAFETDAQFTARVTNDLEQSKETLENDFGINVIGFAYPFNDYGDASVNFPGSEQILDQVVPSIYTYAFYQTWNQNGDTFNYPETNNGPGSTPYMIKRIEPSAVSGADLLQMLDEGVAKTIPYQSDSFADDWVLTWGNISRGDTLALSAASTTSGASAFLNGTGGWQNYLFAASFENRSPGTAITLIARNGNDENYLACAFSDGEVEAEDHVDNAQNILARSSYDFSGTSGQIGIGVDGSRVTCYVSGVPVVGASSSLAVLQKGGIGLEVWNETIGNASAEITQVAVEPFSTAPQ